MPIITKVERSNPVQGEGDVDISNAKTQPAQIHFHPDIVLLCIIIKFIFLKESYHIYEEKS
jgi:hypothetical protein